MENFIGGMMVFAGTYSLEDLQRSAASAREAISQSIGNEIARRGETADSFMKAADRLQQNVDDCRAIVVF